MGGDFRLTDTKQETDSRYVDESLFCGHARARHRGLLLFLAVR